MNALVAVLVTLAVLALRGPRGRAAEGLTPTRASRSVWWREWFVRAVTGARRRAGGADGALDLVTVVTDVASQLRAGAAPGRAWARALGRPVRQDGAPDLDDLTGAGTAGQAAAVIAACRLAAALGAPLAQVLDRVAASLAAAAEADGDRRAALAGPRATARVLTALPVLGVGLGAAMGADPLDVLFSGGIGSMALCAGGVLLAVGRWWIGRLARAASRSGQSP